MSVLLPRHEKLIDSLSDMASDLQDCAVVALRLEIDIMAYNDFGISPGNARQLRSLIEEINAFLAICPVRFEEAGSVYPPGTLVRPLTDDIS